jgi:hypothetical protein
MFPHAPLLAFGDPGTFIAVHFFAAVAAVEAHGGHTVESEEHRPVRAAILPALQHRHGVAHTSSLRPDRRFRDFGDLCAFSMQCNDRRVNHWLGLAVAVIFVWLGMVLAISFLEAPLKFRAPGITIQLGLGIGRLVFRALNICEVVLAAVALVAVILGHSSTGVFIALGLAVAALGAQVVGVRPALARRSDAVLADAAAAASGRSHAHFVYVGFEAVKVVALVVSGVLLLA